MNTTDKIMALAVDYAEWQEAKGFGHPGTAEACQALRAEIEALVRDAERYRWLRSDDIEVLPSQREISVVMHRLPFSDGPDETLTESALDAAIDAAMQEKQS